MVTPRRPPYLIKVKRYGRWFKLIVLYIVYEKGVFIISIPRSVFPFLITTVVWKLILPFLHWHLSGWFHPFGALQMFQLLLLFFNFLSLNAIVIGS